MLQIKSGTPFLKIWYKNCMGVVENDIKIPLGQKEGIQNTERHVFQLNL